MKRYLRLTPLLLCAASLLTACAALQTTPAPLPPLRVEFTQWWGDYTLLVAKEKGFFAEYGVEVEPVYYPIFSDCYADLAAGQIDAGLIASGDVFNINRHAPMRIIGISDDGGYMPIVAVPEIQSIADLKGKRVGTLVGTQYELLVTEMLASAQMTSADVTIQNVAAEEVPAALAEGEIQAAVAWEPFASQAIAQGAHALYPLDENLRLFPNTLAFRQSVVAQRPQDIQAFVHAWFKAVEYRNDPQHETEVREIAARYVNLSANQIQPDPSLKIYGYEENLTLYSSVAGNSILSVAKKSADYLIANGALATAPKLEEIITSDFLSRPQ